MRKPLLESILGRPWIAAALVCALTALFFFPVLQNGFVTWDDPEKLLNNPHYRGLGMSHLKWMFFSVWRGSYQPMAWLTYAADFLVWGLAPLGYHLTNLLFHLLNAGLSFFLIRRVCVIAAPQTAPERQTLVAALGALFFSLHPLRVEAVAWVSARNHLVAASFALGSLLAYLSYRGDRTRKWSYRSSLVLYILSLMSKASAIGLPFALLILDAYPLRRLSMKPQDRHRAGLRAVISEKIPFFLAALPFAWVSVQGHVDDGVMFPLTVHGFGDRIIQIFYSLAYYAFQTLLPLRLSIMDEGSLWIGLSDPLFQGAAVTVLIAASTAWGLRRRWPVLPAACLAYLAFLLPFLGIFDFGMALTGDRYGYLPCLAWSLLAAALILRWLDRGGPARRSLIITAAFGLILSLGFSARTRSMDWRDSQTLYRSILSARPDHTMAHNNLGVILSRSGEHAEAEDHFKTALGKRPHYVKAHINLGGLLIETGRLREGVFHYYEALKVSPNDPEAHTNLGAAWLRIGKLDKAWNHSSAALAADPENTGALNTMGLVLAKNNDLAGAEEYFRKAVRLAPADTVARSNLAALKTLGKKSD